MSISDVVIKTVSPRSSSQYRSAVKVKNVAACPDFVFSVALQCFICYGYVFLFFRMDEY